MHSSLIQYYNTKTKFKITEFEKAPSIKKDIPPFQAHFCREWHHVCSCSIRGITWYIGQVLPCIRTRLGSREAPCTPSDCEAKWLQKQPTGQTNKWPVICLCVSLGPTYLLSNSKLVHLNQQPCMTTVSDFELVAFETLVRTPPAFGHKNEKHKS